MLTSFALALASTVLAAPVPFDKVLLNDGRIIEGKLLESEDDDYIMLRLPGADVPINKTLVDKTFVEDLEGYVPKDDKEAEFLKKGWVLFEGKWMSRTRREGELKKRKAAEKEILDAVRREQNWKYRKKIDTRHFKIESNCTEEVLDEYTERLENYYKFFTDFWGIKRAASERKEKVNVFIYRNPDDFYSVTGSRYGVAGFWKFWEKGLHLYDNPDDREESLDTLYHEGNHMLTWFIDTGFEYPRWMNEGMAEYYGTTVLEEDGDLTVGGLQYGRIVSLRMDEMNKNIVQLRDLLMTDAAGFGYQQYAPAWSFIHFLMESKKYGSTFKSFFRTLPNNKDLVIENRGYRETKGATVATPSLPSVITALEKALGKSLDELESEWREFTLQSYGELTARAYWRAARDIKRPTGEISDEEYDENIQQSFDFYQKAVDLGIESATCYREYAEMLRKGGIDEGFGRMAILHEPDGELAWEMIQKAIDLDPVNPFNYTEAAGILILDGPVQDLDRATAMVDTALALAPLNFGVQSLSDQLMALIEPAKEQRLERERLEREMLEQDLRVWMVLPAYIEGEAVPERIEGLSTEELRELIQDGTVQGNDHIFQTFQMADPETEELIPGSNKWDREWVQLKDIPDFAEDLEAAGWTEAEAQG